MRTLKNPPVDAGRGDGDTTVMVHVTPWHAGNDAGAGDRDITRIQRERGWRYGHDELGNTHMRTANARVWIGFVPEALPDDPHPYQPADVNDDDTTGIWLIRGYPHGAVAWDVSINDAGPVTADTCVPREFISALMAEISAPGHGERDWLADPGGHECVWAIARDAGWAIEHYPDDNRQTVSPCETCCLYWESGCGWHLTANAAVGDRRSLWDAYFTPATPAELLVATMRFLTGPGLLRHPEDVPAYAWPA